MDGPDLEELIRLRYPAGEWALIFELSKGTGYEGAGGRIDAAAFNCWPSQGMHRLGLEVKRTRGDFLREMKKPAKRKWVEENFHETYFVVPAGLVKPEEVPESWGLLMATKDGKKLRQVKQAMHRDLESLPERLALAAIRSMATTLASVQSKEITFDGETITQADLDRKVAASFTAHTESQQKLAEKNFAQQRALDEDRHNLQEPLRLVGAAVMGYDVNEYMHRRDGESCEVTAAQVKEWLGKLATVRDPNQTRRLKMARDALNEILGTED